MNYKIDKLIKELNNFPYVDDIDEKIGQIDTEITFLLSKINESASVLEADPYFKELDIIQICLARLLFKNDFNLPPRLKIFVYEFDRLDDLDTKKTIMSKNRNGAYN